jgi:hypothetical protein
MGYVRTNINNRKSEEARLMNIRGNRTLQHVLMIMTMKDNMEEQT